MRLTDAIREFAAQPHSEGIYRKKDTGLPYNVQVLKSGLVVVHGKKVLGKGREKRARESVAISTEETFQTVCVSVPKEYRKRGDDPLRIGNEARFFALFKNEPGFIAFYGATAYKVEGQTPFRGEKVCLVLERGEHKLRFGEGAPLKENPLALDLLVIGERLGAKGVIHFDIRPQNLYVVQGRLKLSDFGSAVFWREFVHDRKVMDNHPYMAPELHQAITEAKWHSPFLDETLRKIDFQADVFSIGCVLWGMKHGTPPPFVTRFAEHKRNHSFAPDVIHWEMGLNPADLDDEEKILVAMLDPDPKKRITMMEAYTRFKNLWKTN